MARKVALLREDEALEATRVPRAVRIEVLHEAGYRCAVPTCRGIITLDIHHINYVSEGGTNSPENLIALCPTCHRYHHTGIYLRSSIRAWKFLLMALNRAFDVRSVDMLLMLAAAKSLRCSGDGVLTVSPLIAAGLIDVEAKVYSHLEFYYILTLSAKGQAFVGGWKKGDESAALGIPSAGSPGQSSPTRRKSARTKRRTPSKRS